MDREKAKEIFTRETLLSVDDLPDGLPLEEFIDEETEEIDYDAILEW